MTDGDALYRAILEAPDDDAPRLVWADWLEEHGDPDRAAFVRLQCEWANLDPGELREDEMAERLTGLTRNRDAWTACLGHYAQNCGFWRGLPDWFEFSTDRILGALGELRQHVPAQCLSLRLGRTGSGGHDDWAPMETVRCLDVMETAVDPYYPQSSIRGWVWLLQSSRLRGLRTFAAEMNQYSIGTISALAGTDWPNLRELSLRIRFRFAETPSTERWQGLPTAPWRDLADAPWLRRLRSLDLANCNLGDRHMESLLAPNRPWALTRLNLSGNSVSSFTLQRLASSQSLGGLRRLALAMNPVGTSIAYLLRPPALPHLTWLDVSGCDTLDRHPGTDLLRAIARSARPGQLRVLRADGCHVTASSVAHLVNSPSASGLEVLSLIGDELPDEAAIAIAQSPHMGNLRRLDLQGNCITDRGLKALARTTRLGSLRWLTVRGNSMTAAGMSDPAVIDFARRLWLLDTELARSTAPA